MMRLKKYKKRTMNKNIPKTNSIADSNQDSAAISDDMIILDTDPDDPVVVSSSTQESNENGKEQTPAEVIDLDNYDFTGKKKRKRAPNNTCINIECESGKDLRPVTIFCLNYYRVKKKPAKLQEVCAECYEKSILHYEMLASDLKSGKCLIDSNLPTHDEYVEIDSDEDAEESMEVSGLNLTTCLISDECYGFLASELPASMNSVLARFDVQGQVTGAQQHLQERQQGIDGRLKELEDMDKEFQSRLDAIRRALYAEFPRNVEELPAVEFSMVIPTPPQLPQQSMGVSPPKRDPERRSVRNITKPLSYCELTDEVEAPGALEPSPDLEVTQELGPVSVTGIQPDNLPPKGEILRVRPQIGEVYFAQRQSVFGAWGRVRLLEIEQGNIALIYKVKFEGKSKGQSSVKAVTGKQLAYPTPSSVRLEVGTRVIAVFCDEQSIKKESFYAGLIAEPLSHLNHWRYLVFFDDGYAQYVHHEKVLVVCEVSPRVWEDIHPDSQMFIKKYLESYPERPMVKLKPEMVVKTEWNGKWWIARAVKVDGSLVQMHFDADARSEWIYRGSTRLGPLFLEKQAAAARQEKAPHIPKLQQQQKQKNLPAPYVEYPKPPSPSQGAPVPTRAVARKSTNRPPNTLPQSVNMVPFLPTQQVQQPQSKVVYFTPKSVVPPKSYQPHTCSRDCGKLITLPFSALKGYNPLSKPLLVGWHRQMFKYKGKKAIRYRAPCGRTIRCMSELHQYLLCTGSEMSVDNFDFDYWVHCLAEFVLDKTYRSKRDISNGVENVPIPCVNYVDNSMPDFCSYSTKREPMEGVNLNLDENFLCGCDCTDDCADRTKCACWQLTIREARTLNKRVPDELIGYTYKRLPDCVTTGIYECNSRCKCAKTCLNRVVQHPLQLKLQLFKTANRGWGIRCLNDIPHGAFICIYAGSLLTDKMANEGGVNYGDEYLAELDYIEVVERQKDGYESDVSDIEDDDDDNDTNSPKNDSNDDDNENDDDFTLEKDFTDSLFRSNVKVTTESAVTTRSRIRNNDTATAAAATTSSAPDEGAPAPTATAAADETVTISDDEEIVREKSSFAPSSQTEDQIPVSKFKSVRKMFGDDEYCYIMDAKNTGNIGRFLNHSCSPNVFVQNVFVDTHDLRFPWVAFFAMNYIRAGTELTWNYNYDVGSVPGKVIFCHCGSPDCRGRLL